MRSLLPSKTRSSLPPTWLTYTRGMLFSLAIRESILSLTACFPAVNGEADMLTIHSAPAVASSAMGSVW